MANFNDHIAKEQSEMPAWYGEWLNLAQDANKMELDALQKNKDYAQRKFGESAASQERQAAMVEQLSQEAAQKTAGANASETAKSHLFNSYLKTKNATQSDFKKAMDDLQMNHLNQKTDVNLRYSRRFGEMAEKRDAEVRKRAMTSYKAAVQKEQMEESTRRFDTEAQRKGERFDQQMGFKREKFEFQKEQREKAKQNAAKGGTRSSGKKPRSKKTATYWDVLSNPNAYPKSVRDAIAKKTSSKSWEEFYATSEDKVRRGNKFYENRLHEKTISY